MSIAGQMLSPKIRQFHQSTRWTVISHFLFIRITTDRLLLNETYAEEQLHLWFTNGTGKVLIIPERLSDSNIFAGAYSAVPVSLGMAKPTDIFSSTRLHTLINSARRNLNQTAIEYSNGNPKVAAGLRILLNKTLELYEQGTGLPVELNLGMRICSSSMPTPIFS